MSLTFFQTVNPVSPVYQLTLVKLIGDKIISSCNLIPPLASCHAVCAVEWPSWATYTGVFLQHGSKAWTSVGRSARLLYCKNCMRWQNMKYTCKMTTWWLPSGYWEQCI